MPLVPGARLGPYEIASILGTGGMGEVYRARDTRLGRDVAVKVLPAELAGDSAALARFEREARAVAALSHPNILAIFDIGQESSTVYAVAELLEGQTLRERLQAGPIPVRKALDYARALAEALAAAHDRGIVHRDLKPENIFVTADGRIKVLDFGLAQIAPPLQGLDATMARHGTPTTPGMVVGTIGYMSPEQVRAQATDHRTDIFALGAVLYEMLTGQRAFAGASAADSMSAILQADPPELPRIGLTATPGIERVVRRCLEKSPPERFQSARDLAFALDALSVGSSTASSAIADAPGPRSRKGRLRWIAVIAVVACAAAGAGVLAGRRSGATAARSPMGRFAIAANPTQGAAPPVVSVSPDGRYIAYRAPGPQGAAVLWLRRLDTAGVNVIDGTESAGPPFWSPDGHQLAYFLGAALYVRDVPAGAPRRVGDLPTPDRVFIGSWGAHDRIVVAAGNALYLLSAGGGAPKPLPRGASGSEVWRGFPSFLPDGERFLYTVALHANDESGLETRIASTDGRELGTVLSGGLGTFYAGDHLFYGSGGRLLARPFDARAARITGEAIEVAPSAMQDWRSGYTLAAASENGVVAVRPAPKSDVRFTWMDRDGRQLGSIAAVDSFTNFDVAPDGQRILATRRDPLSVENRLWLIDAQRGVTSLVSAPGEPNISDPTWAPDGRHIAYRRGGQLVMRLANGGEERVLLEEAGYPDSFTRDGRYVLYGAGRGNLYELFALDVNAPGAKPIPLVTGQTLADEGRFSPNGRTVAYHSNGSGSLQVWAIRFPPTGEKWQVSTSGGVQPRWSADGNELFYLDLDGRVVSVRMPGSDPTKAETPRVLFSTGVAPSSAIDQFAAVGDRFLFRIPASADFNGSIEVIMNWTPPK